MGASGISTALRIRLILAPLLFSAVLWPEFYQPLLDTLWLSLRHTSFYNWSTFETIWTVFLYAVIEPSLTVVFLNHPEWRFIKPRKHNAKPHGMRRPSRRIGEGILYMAPLLAMDLTMMKKFAGVELEQMLESGNYDTAGLCNSTAPFPTKTFLVPTLHNFTYQSPFQTARALPIAAPSSRRLVLELATSFLIYDTLFFLFHLCLHTLPLLRKAHMPHHQHDAQLHPQVTNRLSVLERLGLVLLANFSLNVIGSHVLTRTLFVPLFVWLLVELHSGMDLPWGYEKVLPRGWGGGARKHMKHHNTGEGGFEPFFCWWDGGWDWVRRAVK